MAPIRMGAPYQRRVPWRIPEISPFRALLLRRLKHVNSFAHALLMAAMTSRIAVASISRKRVFGSLL